MTSKIVTVFGFLNEVTALAQWVTAVAQQPKAPGIYCYGADSIPAVTPRYCQEEK